MRHATIELRVTVGEKREWQAVAEQRGVSLSELIRSTMADAGHSWNQEENRGDRNL